MASVTRAEEVIEAAKKIMRKRNLEKARLFLQKKRLKEKEAAIRSN